MTLYLALAVYFIMVLITPFICYYLMRSEGTASHDDMEQFLMFGILWPIILPFLIIFLTGMKYIDFMKWLLKIK